MDTTETLLKNKVADLEKELALTIKQYDIIKEKYDIEHTMLIELLDKYNNIKLEYNKAAAQIDLIQTNFLKSLTP